MKHVVGFSGGADSQACAGWVLDRYGPEDTILMNSQAGRNEHPLTTEHVAWYSANVHPVIEVVPLVRDLGGVGTREGATADRRATLPGEDSELTFPMLAFVKGRFPSRKAQFCTKFLKMAPQKRWLDENLTARGVAYIRYAGVRADESQDRADLPEVQWDDWFDTELHRPLIRWTKAEVFEFLKVRGERINPLYTLGFSRVGCAPCINSGKDDVRSWAAPFSRDDRQDKAVGARGRPDVLCACVPGKEINWIDEVVEWSRHCPRGKTDAPGLRRGGRGGRELCEQIRIV